MPTDLDKLQGTWNVTSFEADGPKMTATAFDGAKIIIKGEKFTSVAMGAVYRGTVELHPARKPKSFDLVFTAGPEKGNRNRGIYKLDGDHWTICLATRGSTRPQKFATRPGTGVALEALERDDGARAAVKGRSQPERLSGRSAPTELEAEWTMVWGIFDGKALAANMVKWCKRITRGDVTAVVAAPQTMLKARFTIDSSTNPHAIEYTNIEGASAGKMQSGIFVLSGETLKICMSPSGKPRPADFSSKSGDGRLYTTWRFARKKLRQQGHPRVVLSFLKVPY